VRAARNLPRAKLIRYGAEARHEILREVDPVRDRVLADIEDFLASAAPAAG
jgi:lysophospholipase